MMVILVYSSDNQPLLTQHRTVKSIAHKLDTSTKAVLLRYLLMYNIPVLIDNTMDKSVAHLLQVLYAETCAEIFCHPYSLLSLP